MADVRIRNARVQGKSEGGGVMARTTNRELDDLARLAGELSGDPTLFIGHAYGRPRLESHGGAFEISPRLSAGDLAMWIHAYIDGIGARETAVRRAERMRAAERMREERAALNTGD